MEAEKNHYCSFEDINSRINSYENSDFMPFSAHTSTMPFLKNFPGHTVAEVGPEGGVVKLPEYEIAVHCETTENLGWKHCTSCLCYTLGNHGYVDRTMPARRQSFKYKLFRQLSGNFSINTNRNHTLRDSACEVPPHYDGRVQLALEEPTSTLVMVNSLKLNPGTPGSPAKKIPPEKKKYLPAGPLLRISFADKLFFNEVVVKFSTNVELKHEVKPNLCSITCLLGNSRYGSFAEFDRFLRYGNTFQMSLNIQNDLKGKIQINDSVYKVSVCMKQLEPIKKRNFLFPFFRYINIC